MPWPFGSDDNAGGDGTEDRALNRRGRRLKWRGQKQKAKREPAPMAKPPASAPVLYEAYEPRLLLSGAPVGTVLASSTGAAEFQDADGTKVTATLSGPGQWQFVQGMALPTLVITGTDATSVFSIEGVGGDGRVALEGVTLAGPMASFSAPTTDPVSTFTVGGAVQAIVLGNVRDMVLSSTAAIGSVAVESWQAGGMVANGISAPSLDSLTSSGQLNLNMSLTALGQALGSVMAGGALSGGLWQVAGDVGSIGARAIGAGWAADVSGGVGLVQTVGNFAGTLSTESLDVVAVGGNFVGGRLMVGADLGGDGRLGGAGFDADTFGAGYIGQLRVAGAMIGARVHVGVDPVNGVYDDGDDLIVGGAASRIQTLIVGGRIDSTSRIVTGVLPPSFFAAGQSYTTATAPKRLSTVPGDSRRPDLSATLANDTGPSATDRVTADPTVVGSVTDAGGIAALSGGLDGAPAAQFVDLLEFVSFDGSFTLGVEEMETLAGGPLPEGRHVLHLLAVDKAGNARRLDFAFTYSNTQITLALANDTGLSASDGVSQDYAVAGKVDGGAAIATASVALNGGVGAALTLAGDGGFALSKAQIDALAGGALKEGAHVLRVAVEDANGIPATRELAFTYDATAPKIASFGLTPSSDTGTVGDGITAAARVGLLGVSEPGAVATLGGAQALVSASGGFQFADVVLADGTNTLKVTVADLAGNTSTMTVEVERSGAVTTDAALTWNQATLEVVRKTSLYPETATRIMAMVGIAQFDTLAAIEGTQAFLVARTHAGPVDVELALAKAAHTVLWASFPSLRADFDAVLAPMLAAVPDGEAKATALALGGAIGQAVLDIRASDGSENYVEYLASDTPGRWRPTAPSYEVAEEPQWAELTPFAMAAPDQFLAPPPPDLESAEYAAAVAEVKALGSAISATRTADQTEQAQFWADGRGSYTPPGHWNQIAQQIAQAQGNSLAANVRLFAQLNVALADTAIASWNTKFTYSLWRPIDAIQQADRDGNDATAQDVDWQPLLITPPHPDYVSGHSSFSGAGAAVLKAVFGEMAFSTSSYTLPAVTRSFSSFEQAAQEAGRSRIYGGIHFQFANTAGLTLGAQVAGAALARFNLAQDTQGPNIVAAILPGVTAGNVTLNGQVLDNLSGVDAAWVSIDGGAAQPLALDAEGRYVVSTSFALDGTADGLHSIAITARDAAGNESGPVVRNFRLDTRLPTVLLTSIEEGATISGATRLTGWASPTGSTLSALNYSFNGGPVRPIFFDAATGYFDSSLNLSALDIGTHTLTLRATDAAGNVATLTRTVALANLPAFFLSAIGPTDGEVNIGTTERPEVRFSRAVKIDSLTSESLYATTADGTRLAATIVPSLDGSFANLFFNAPMPGGTKITLHVDGNRIRAAADGAFLDADLDGTAGGVRTVTFTTVSLTPVAGTTLRGRVVDPGPDLQPMTFDDMRRGPDGIAYTDDDVFLNPVANAKVFLLGLEGNVVYTDAEGYFELTNLPSGNVKVAIDGRTATNMPAGVFWPEMVMDANLRPGAVNTVADTMGTAAERAARAGRLEVYLPRVPATIFSVVSDTAPTTVTVDEGAAPNLTDAQRTAMSVTVAPGSVIGEDGRPLTNAQVGISTVPPELVRDMLPPGVLQHTFDITIQAPGAATFAVPATISFPNVFGAAPGTKLNILSFDHTTGMLVINGTATVSEDGLTVVSDEGAGPRSPGWHGVTPPGGCNPAGGAPPDPVPPSKDEKVTEHAPTVLTFLMSDKAADNFGGLSWKAPPATKELPPLPPIPGCEVPPHNPDTKAQPFISVTIEVDGALGQFAKPVNGSVNLTSQSFTLSAGTGIEKKFDFDPKTYAEMFTTGQGFADLNKDQLYGARIKITEIRQQTDGSRTRDIYTYYGNRFVAAVHGPSAVARSGDSMAFFRTNTDGIVRTNSVDLFLPSTVKTSFTGGGAPFTLAGSFAGNGTLTGQFDPDKGGFDQKSTFNIQVSDAKGPLTVGNVTAIGTGTAPSTVSVDEAGYRAELSRTLLAVSLVTEAGKDGTLGTADDTKTYYYDYGGGVTVTTLPGVDGKLGTADDVTLNTVAKANQLGSVGASFLAEFKNFLPDKKYTAKDFNAMLDSQVKAMKAAVEADFSPAGKQYQVVASNAGADVTMSWQDAFFPPTGQLVYGYADFDRARPWMVAYLAQRGIDGKGSIGQAALEWAMAEGLNKNVNNSGVFGVAINFDWSSGATFAQFVANTVSHEIGHTFGLNEAYLNGPPTVNINPPNDIMRSGNTNDGDLTFAATNIAVLKAALGLQPDGQTPISAAVKEYRTNINAPNSAKGLRESKNELTTPSMVASWADIDVTNGTTVTFGPTVVDGVGGTMSTLDVTLTNVGFSTLTLAGFTLGDGGKGFSIVDTGLKGATLDPYTSTKLTLAFDPAVLGAASDTLTILSDSDVGPLTFTLAGTGRSLAPVAQVVAGHNNFGGMLVGAPAASLGGLFSISNGGANPLEITGVSIIEGAAEFTLLDVPTNLATTPASLAFGESLSFGLSFSPSRLGLQRAVIEVTTNDPARPVLRLGAVGTGVSELPTAKWGRDFVGLQVTTPNNPPPLNTVSDDKGFFSFFLPSNSPYRMTVFDPATGLVAQDFGKTADSGKGVNLTATLVFGASVERDGDFDGLPDDIEFAIGSNPRAIDTDRDGLNDFTEVQQGLDPLGGLGLPVGVVSAASLQGRAESVAVTGSTVDPTVLTAFVATGSAGLAVVDVSSITSPRVLAELDLPGTSTRVAVDNARGIALLAAGAGGLHFVDVSTPGAPSLVRTESYAGPVAAVALRDGSAFVASGGRLLVVDVATGDLRQTLDLGSAPLREVVVAVDAIYTFDAARVLRVLSVVNDVVITRGSVTLPDGGSRMTVGNGVAYVTASTGGAGGYLTVDVNNPDSPVLISDVDSNALAGTAMALNGSGLGLIAGGIDFVFDGFRGVDLVDVSDPTNTAAFLQRFLLPDFARDVTIANGVAFVAGGSGGLQVINYRSFDTLGTPPTVDISIGDIDVDAGKDGVQVLEGRSLHIVPTVADDVQVRNVELLVNGKVVVNDPTFPFDLFADVPSIKAGGSAMTVQVRATDTGGNIALSKMLTIDVVPDTFPPEVTAVSVADGAKRFFLRGVDVSFDEGIDPATINGAAVTVVRAGNDGVFDTADDVAVAVKLDTRSLNHVLSVAPVLALLPGDYRFTLGAGAVADVAGNALTTPVVRHFNIRPASDVKAMTGAPEEPAAPSANPGQVIGVPVPFDPVTARMTFVTIDSSGTLGSTTVPVSRVDAATGTAFFAVPYTATTGDAKVFSQVGETVTEFADGEFLLQVVPVVTGGRIDSISGNLMNVTLTGFGFIEGNGSAYQFGTEVVVDGDANTGPNVFSGPPNFVGNDNVTVQVPLTDAAFGAVSVRTTGGTSIGFSVDLAGIGATAMSGTPANAALPSANPGQAITLLGSGLAANTAVVFSFIESSGATVSHVRVLPTTVAANGTSATVVVPRQANGISSVRILGSQTRQQLQIVPTLDSYRYSGGTLVLTGSGLVEAGSTFLISNATVTDAAVPGRPDIYFATSADNTGANLDTMRHGFGTISVTTAGGTSAPLPSAAMSPALGVLRDIAVTPGTGALWVADSGNPLVVHQIDPATGAPTRAIALPSAAIGSGGFTGGLQVTSATFTLGATEVPAGSLLVFNANTSPDRVVAIDLETEEVIATLPLAGNYDTSGGVFDPVTGSLFLIDRSVSTDRLVRLNAATGAQEGAFNLPRNFSEGGLAIAPAGGQEQQGNLWYVTSSEQTAFELSRTGEVLRRVDLELQGISGETATGVAVRADGMLLISTSNGRVFAINPAFDPALPIPVLNAIVGTATRGTAASGAVASANAGQVIELSGSNFGDATQVLFPVRDSLGVAGIAAVAPTLVNPDGTRLQVRVPDRAMTGDIRVSNVAQRNLGGTSFTDSIHRNVTVQFTAGDSSVVVRFADGGIEDVGNESWGLDNVVVRQGDTVVFSDNFESGTAHAAWSDPRVASNWLTNLTRFSGRFASEEQRLTLSGLTAGQTYTLSFDLYALDSWDGSSTSGGPDLFQVRVDDALLFNETISNFSITSPQTIGNSAGRRLQVVPTVTGLTGQPGLDSVLTINGSGFQEGASTISVGGIVVVDRFLNDDFPAVTSWSTNNQYQLMVPRSLDGPVRVSTEGGFDEVAGPSFFRQEGATFTGITAESVVGTPTQLGQAASNVGKTIKLHGSGFTHQTMVQFDAADDTGRLGTVTREVISVSAGGREATVLVPALARTGTVRVLGVDAGHNLQIVPTLRAIGGTVAPGNTLVIEATGLVQPEVVVQVDNRTIGTFTLRTVSDGTGQNWDYLAERSTQQLMTLVLPNGVSNGVVTVATVGGTATLRTAVAPAITTQTPAVDVGDTLETALALDVGRAQGMLVNAQIGDGTFAARDVDIYRVQAQEGDRLVLGLNNASAGIGRIRVFTDTGSQLRVFSSGQTQVEGVWTSGPYVFEVPATGVYYLGVSSGSGSYNPTVAGSKSSSTAFTYQISVVRNGPGDTSLTAIEAAAGRGTAAQAGVASANVGQTITLRGTAMSASDRVVFTTVDASGYYGETTVAPLSVAADRTSLTVAVPSAATTGQVRLERDAAGILLQVVPTVDGLTIANGQPFQGGSLELQGSGFAEGSTTLLFGSTALPDVGRFEGINVYETYSTELLVNSRLTAQVPNGVPTGPLRVSTVGGTSDTLAIDFTGITAAAASGTPTNAALASANPRQSIEIQGVGLTLTSGIVFTTSNSSTGAEGERVVRPWAVSADGTVAQVVVPDNAATGVVRVVGDRTASARMLQVVPTVSAVDVNYISGNADVAFLWVHGAGLVEGLNTEYRFGSTTVVDGNASVGPDVAYNGTTGMENGIAYMRVPLTDAIYGQVRVKTAGGTSAPFSAGFTGVTTTALSGTPANAGLASANPGQAITLQGAGLSTGSDILVRYTRENGTPDTALVNPVSAATDGTSATLVLPNQVNGVAELRIIGSATTALVQIVPTLRSVSVGGGTIYIEGSGFVEGASTVDFAGVQVVDTEISGGPNVTWGSTGENGRLDVAEPAHGLGNLIVTTAGGTSAPLAIAHMRLPYGFLQDLALDPTTGDVWVVDNANPGNIRRVDIATAAVQAEVPVTAAAFGTTYFWGGLQVVPQTFTLNGVTVPAGSLLGFNGQANPDGVYAVDPATGTQIAALALGGNYDTPAGVFHPGTGHLFVLDRRTAPHQILRVNPQDASVVSSFTAPFNATYAGMAIDPVTGNIWFGSNTSNTVMELTPSGEVVRSTNFALQGGESGSISGLTFDAAGRLMVATTNGRINFIDTGFDPVITRPTLSGIVATAQSGVAASKAEAASNVGQVIELVGSNFGGNSRVIFETRNSEGAVGTAFQAPLAINADGTRLQVQVPNLATTGAVRVVNSATQDLGFAGWADGIYRQITLDFTADDATTLLRFADSGIEVVDNESWALDNVKVTQGGTTVFADDFEGKAQAGWSDTRRGGSASTPFTTFSGRFAKDAQTLELNGLSAGQTYQLTFDLYAFDSWDGMDGHDMFQVSADGTVLLREFIANFAPSQRQTLNASETRMLQVVPTLTGTGGSGPGSHGSYTLHGSGFMEGASTITVGGMAFADTFVSSDTFDVHGSRNDTFTVITPMVLDGAIRVTTAGGYAEIAAPTRPAPAPSLFTGIRVPALEGGTQVGNTAAANAGQTIVLLGQGFTHDTRVHFEAVDDTGAVGVITRSGSHVNATGTELSVQVPALARSGTVTVLGATGSHSLLVVPWLRSHGGATTEGNVVLIDGSGLVLPELKVEIDGKAAPFQLRTVTDGGTFNLSSASAQSVQQLLTVTVPAGVGAGAIKVATGGGSAMLAVGATKQLDAIATPDDVGDTLADARAVELALNEAVRINSSAGNGTHGQLDVDLYSITLAAGDQLRVRLEDGSFAMVRVFDADGAQKAAQVLYDPDYGSSHSPLTFRPTAGGTYFVGVSGYTNATYDPNTAGSGAAGDPNGSYGLSLVRSEPGMSRLTGIVATAGLGTPAQGTVASANPTQTITLLGTGITATDRVVFTTLSNSNAMATESVAPASVAADGTSLTVVVPNAATTGMVRLERDSAGVLLQVVPVLLGASAGAGGLFDGTIVTLTGRGFAEGVSTIHFGDVDVIDGTRGNSSSVGNATIANQSTRNGRYTVLVPPGADAGPLRITTVGGTSNTLGLSFSGLAATAGSGTPADAAKASANPGQTITLQGTAFDAGMSVIFDAVRSDGSMSSMVVRPASVTEDRTSATVVVPFEAVTGRVRILGDASATEAELQIVPLITDAQITSIDGNNLVMMVQLSGRGFIEGASTTYAFGNTLVEDISISTGPDVYPVYSPAFAENSAAQLSVAYSDASFGPITVRTAGGTSAPFSTGFTGVTATAATGTPADANEASANPGQTITLVGTGLSTALDVVLHYRESSAGLIRSVRLSPSAASEDGTSATLTIPTYMNGAIRVQVFGSSAQPLLQIVPVVSGYDVSGTSLYITGSGFVEGASTVDFAGATVVDTSTDATTDTYYAGAADNTGLRVFEPTHGFGPLTVTTAGGTSAAFDLNEMTLPYGHLRDVAFDRTTGALWVGETQNPSKLRRVDTATGAELQTIDFTNATLGSTFFWGGLQIVPAAFQLNGVAVPAGSLLVFNGGLVPDRVVALDQTTGAVIATLPLAANYDLVSGVFHPGTGDLFVTDRRTGPHKIVRISAATGAEVSNFTAPVNASNGGMAVDPVTGNLWYGADHAQTLFEITIAGEAVRSVSTTSLGINQNEIGGLAFETDTTILVSSTQGRVYRIPV